MIPTKNDSALSIIKYWAIRGLSDRSIAAKCGMNLSEFYDALELEQNRIKPLKIALELARAEFEAERVSIKDNIMNDPETSKGLKYKIVREDLKTLEAWAPATRTVKVQVENAPTEFAFGAYSPDELANIAQQSASADNKNNNGEETDSNS
jgi:hypothetical protein